jgi:hypothetical protein
MESLESRLKLINLVKDCVIFGEAESIAVKPLLS